MLMNTQNVNIPDHSNIAHLSDMTTATTSTQKMTACADKYRLL